MVLNLPRTLPQEYTWIVLHRSWHDITEGAKLAVQICSDCGYQALADKVEIPSEPDLPMWIASAAQLIRPVGGMEPCARGGALMVSSDESGTVCSSCWEDAIRSDIMGEHFRYERHPALVLTLGRWPKRS